MDQPEEIWKDIVGYDGIYQVSSLGRIKSIERLYVRDGQCTNQVAPLKIIKTTKKLYENFTLCKNGKIKNGVVHRIIAMAFIPNPFNKPFINHINGIKLDNRLDNLEWCTQKENIRHAFDTGLSKARIGDKNNLSKTILKFDLNGNLIEKITGIREYCRNNYLQRKDLYTAIIKEKEYKGFIYKK